MSLIRSLYEKIKAIVLFIIFATVMLVGGLLDDLNRWFWRIINGRD